jgi:hypothetical protein
LHLKRGQLRSLRIIRNENQQIAATSRGRKVLPTIEPVAGANLARCLHNDPFCNNAEILAVFMAPRTGVGCQERPDIQCLNLKLRVLRIHYWR